MPLCEVYLDCLSSPTIYGYYSEGVLDVLAKWQFPLEPLILELRRQSGSSANWSTWNSPTGNVELVDYFEFVVPELDSISSSTLCVRCLESVPNFGEVTKPGSDLLCGLRDGGRIVQLKARASTRRE